MESEPKDDQEEIIKEKIKDKNGRTSYVQYKKGKFLGKGGFAKCYEVTNIDTGKVSACKIISKESLLRGRAK